MDQIQPKPYGRKVALYFALAFAVVLSVNIYMVRVALHTNTGTVMEHPYETGLKYNSIIHAADQQATLGWKGVVAFTPTGERSGTVHFTLADANGAPLAPEKITATLYRPSRKGMDFAAPLNPVADGYEARVSFPVEGLWEIRIFAYVGAQPFQTIRRVVVR